MEKFKIDNDFAKLLFDGFVQVIADSPSDRLELSEITVAAMNILAGAIGYEPTQERRRDCAQDALRSLARVLDHVVATGEAPSLEPGGVPFEGTAEMDEEMLREHLFEDESEHDPSDRSITFAKTGEIMQANMPVNVFESDLDTVRQHLSVLGRPS
jgi:hypothetical protein